MLILAWSTEVLSTFKHLYRVKSLKSDDWGSPVTGVARRQSGTDIGLDRSESTSEAKVEGVKRMSVGVRGLPMWRVSGMECDRMKKTLEVWQREESTLVRWASCLPGRRSRGRRPDPRRGSGSEPGIPRSPRRRQAEVWPAREASSIRMCFFRSNTVASSLSLSSVCLCKWGTQSRRPVLMA